jgi:integrase
MVLGPEGHLDSYIRLEDRASKGRSGRSIPINQSLLRPLENHLANTHERHPHSFVIATERAVSTTPHVIVNLFSTWYERLGFLGCPSHSGAARQISTVGGSLRDVQVLAGHASLSTTQRYIEWDAHAQKRLVELL